VILLVYCLLVGLWGCTGSEEESPPPPEPPLFQRKPRAPKANQQADQAKQEGELSYSYDPTGRRDPFKSLISPKKGPSETKEEVVEIVSPLQEYDLSSLTVVGVVWGALGKRAMVRTPDGKGYTVTENVPIGKGRSRVVQITQEGLVIEVISRDSSGKLVREMVLMELRKKEG
jgi:type IV pilus assembly protein PilP